MFVYQNKEGQICVTFTDNKPVEAPEFVIAIDEEAKTLYMVAGEIAPMPATDEVTEVAEVDETDDTTVVEDEEQEDPATEE